MCTPAAPKHSISPTRIQLQWPSLSPPAKRKTRDVVLCGAGGDELLVATRATVSPTFSALFRRFHRSGEPRQRQPTGYPSDVLAWRPVPSWRERLLTRPTKEIDTYLAGNWSVPITPHNYSEERFEKLHPHKDRVRGNLWNLIAWLWLVDESLRLNDAMTMASGVECRVLFSIRSS